MLNIYLGDVNIPRDKTFFYDANGLVPLIDLTADNITRNILKDIEQAVPQTHNSFLDRYARGFYTNALSISSLILIGAYQNPDIIVNGEELGDNAFWYLNNLSQGAIYFPFGDRKIDDLDCPICLNGKVCDTDEALWVVFEEVMTWQG